MTDLDNVSNCPLGVRCESCGAEGNDLAVRTVRLARLGVACMTLCPRCARSGVQPPITAGTGVRLVLQHCRHLGITGDEMDELLRGER